MGGCLGHHDHLARQRRDRLENRTLVWRGVFEDCVGDHDRRDAQAFDDVDDFVSVDTSVDADSCWMIATSLRFSNSAYAATDAGEPLTSSPMTGVLADGGPSEIRTTLTSAPLAVNPFASAAERGKPALCRWIRTENAETQT